MPSGGITLVSRENYWTNAGGTTLMSRAKLSYVYLHISSKFRENERLKNYWDFYVLLKCIVITIFTDLSETPGGKIYARSTGARQKNLGHMLTCSREDVDVLILFMLAGCFQLINDLLLCINNTFKLSFFLFIFFYKIYFCLANDDGYITNKCC